MSDAAGGSTPREAWIVDGVRTPIGRHGGGLASVRPDDLAAVTGMNLEVLFRQSVFDGFNRFYP